MKNDYKIYFIVDKIGIKTYVGFSNDVKRRLQEHKNHKVNTTKQFKSFKMYILETVNDVKIARTREKYWKSCAGRKKLKELFNNS